VHSAILGEPPHTAGWPDFQAVNCLSALVSVEPDSAKAFVETKKGEPYLNPFQSPGHVRFYARFCASFERFKIRLFGGFNTSFFFTENCLVHSQGKRIWVSFFGNNPKPDKPEVKTFLSLGFQLTR
jgi:hypothetical protein